MKTWMSTKLCVGLLGSIINPVSLNRRQFRNMLRKTVAPRKPQQSLGIGQTKSKPCSVLSDRRMRTKKPEDVSRSSRWDYAEILWNGIRAEAVREAFEKLNYREQTLLEKRNAICMTCGRVSPMSTQLSLKNWQSSLRAARPVVQNGPTVKPWIIWRCLLTEAGVLHIIRLKRKSQTKRKKKIAAAVYLYQVDNDGEWGEVSFDFEAGTAEIVRLAEWDTTVGRRTCTKSDSIHSDL